MLRSRPCGFDRDPAPNPPVSASGKFTRRAFARAYLRPDRRWAGMGAGLGSARPRVPIEGRPLCLSAPVDSPGSLPGPSGCGQPNGQEPSCEARWRSSFTWNTHGTAIASVAADPRSAGGARRDRRAPRGADSGGPAAHFTRVGPSRARSGAWGGSGPCVSRGTLAGVPTSRRRHRSSLDSMEPASTLARRFTQPEGPGLVRLRVVGAGWHHTSSRITKHADAACSRPVTRHGADDQAPAPSVLRLALDQVE
jgi:hypothetical protein